MKMLAVTLTQVSRPSIEAFENHAASISALNEGSLETCAGCFCPQSGVQ
jgi:hypothetical protein